MTNPAEEPVDVIVLAGIPSPGIAVLPNGGNSPRKWDEKKGYGTSGASIVYTGDGLAKFSVKILLVAPSEWDAWELFEPLVQRPPDGTAPKAMDIWHPFLVRHRISSVVVEDLVGPTPALDGTAYEWEIKFLQYRAPKPATAKVAGSSTSKSKAGGADSSTDALIKSLTGQVQALA